MPQKLMEITRQRFVELMVAEEKLARLEGAGVDNWDYYDEAMHPGEDNGDDIEGFKRDLEKKTYT